MMQIRQQINLYQPLFRKQTIEFGIGAVFLTLGIMVAALGLISGVMVWQQHGLETINDELTARNNKLSGQLLAMKSQQPKAVKNILLEKQLETLTKQRDEERVVFSLLEKELQSMAVPMSSFFAGLARNKVDGLWLTDISIDSRNDQLELEGSVLVPELVPRLLSKLAGEQAFEGRSFQVLKLARPEEKNQMNFQLIATREDLDESS